jgi:hypothetical protein
MSARSSLSNEARSVIGACLSFLLFVASGQRHDAVVAEFGPHRITLSEYRLAYQEVVKNPGVFDSPAVREQCLDDMIAGRLLAAEAKRRGRGVDDAMQASIDAYRDRRLRRAHFDAVIKPAVRVEERDVEEAYQFTQEQRRLSHLFFPDLRSADSVHALLVKGASFEALASGVFADSALARSGGDLGWVSWDQLDYDLAMTAFRLKVGTVSSPVASSFGYHILKVTDFKKNPLITRQQYEDRRRKARYLLESKIGDREALVYVRDMLSRATIRLNPEVLDFVRGKLQDIFTRKPSAADQFSEVQLQDEEIRKVELTLWDSRREAMAVVNGAPLTVEWFMGAIQYVPYSVVHSSFRATFDYAIRDFLLTREAVAKGLDRQEDVVLATELFEEYQIQQAFRRDLVRSVTVTEAELRAAYEQNRSTWHEVPFDSVRGFVQDALTVEKKQTVVPSLVRELSGETPVTKHMDIINGYYDNLLKAAPR